MSTAQAAIKSARIYLNDINGLTWSESILMPLLQEAFGEMMQELDVNQLGVLKYQTPVITVIAGQLNLGTNQPTNILEPISMQERTPGDTADSFVDMYKVNFLPEETVSQYLTWWCWNAELITFLGSDQNREVILRYKGFLTTPVLLTDPIGVIFGERFLGPRIAALAYDSIGKDSAKLSDIASKNLYTLVQRAVLYDQSPVRRKGYRSSGSSGTSGIGTVINR